MTKVFGIYTSEHNSTPEAIFTDPILAKEYLNALVLESEFESSYYRDTPRLEEITINPEPPKLFFRYHAHVLLNHGAFVAWPGTPHGVRDHYVRWDGGAQYSVHNIGDADDGGGLKWVEASSPVSYEHAAELALRAAQRYAAEPFKTYVIFDENHEQLKHDLELDLARDLESL